MRTSLLALALSALLGGASASARDIDERSRQEALRHYRTGQESMHAEAWDEAEREFLAAIRLDPLLAMAHYGLGQVYMATKRYPNAVEAYTRCREAFHQTEALRLSDQAAADRRLEDQIEALKHEKRMMESGLRIQNPDRRPLQKVEQQIRELERLKRRNPTEALRTPPGVSLALGSAYFRTGAFADAEREYRAALEVASDIGEAHNNLAVVYMLTGRLDQAEEEVRRAEAAGFEVRPGLKRDIESRKPKR